MDNGSLDRWLFRDTVLEWAVRYQIALDTAQGLCYLHRDCRHKIVHLDVKPQNILLDDRFRARVADFGLSKLFDRDMSQVMTRMRGTPGYLAPEWLLQMGITEKCDVFSYGMVLLEIVSGRRNIDVCETPARWYFPAWAVQCLQEQSWREIVDAQIQSSLTADDWEQMKKVVAIAMWCIQDAPRMRPSMARVVQMLEGVVEVDAAPLHYEFLHIASGEAPPSPISTPSVPTSAAERGHGPRMEMKALKGSYCEPDSQLSLSPR
jgi:serine/threonine protein kinase